MRNFKKMASTTMEKSERERRQSSGTSKKWVYNNCAKKVLALNRRYAKFEDDTTLEIPSMENCKIRLSPVCATRT